MNLLTLVKKRRPYSEKSANLNTDSFFKDIARGRHKALFTKSSQLRDILRLICFIDERKMLKNILYIFIAIFVCSCATKRQDISGIDGSEVPAAFSSFPDVPFPSESYIDLGDTKVLGSGDKWIGSLVFTTPYNASRVFDFYMTEMPKYKWTEIAIVRAKISQMTYFRQNRAIQVLIEMLSDNKSRVSITAIPNQATDSI